MDCFRCKNAYNETDKFPRLLIQCGHSICDNCTSELYNNEFIICPECKYKNVALKIQFFPKNLALINVNKQRYKSNDKQKHPEIQYNESHNSIIIDFNKE